jgi:hypothetical protein
MHVYMSRVDVARVSIYQYVQDLFTYIHAYISVCSKPFHIYIYIYIYIYMSDGSVLLSTMDGNALDCILYACIHTYTHTHMYIGY